MKYEQWKREFIDRPRQTQYNKFKDSVHETIKKEYSIKLNSGQQDKHIIGTNNYIPGRSTLTADPAELIELYAGKGEPIQTNKGTWGGRERFIHSDTIGVYVSPGGLELPTRRGVMHYSKKKGIHIVPGKPKKGD
ncbi:MAG: polymorphic toxin type 50 domain-containing protein [Oscillospiraceae bacterium]|jgi:hypothetical protein